MMKLTKTNRPKLTPEEIEELLEKVQIREKKCELFEKQRKKDVAFLVKRIKKGDPEVPRW